MSVKDKHVNTCSWGDHLNTMVEHLVLREKLKKFAIEINLIPIHCRSREYHTNLHNSYLCRVLLLKLITQEMNSCLLSEVEVQLLLPSTRTVLQHPNGRSGDGGSTWIVWAGNSTQTSWVENGCILNEFQMLMWLNGRGVEGVDLLWPWWSVKVALELLKQSVTIFLPFEHYSLPFLSWHHPDIVTSLCSTLTWWWWCHYSTLLCYDLINSNDIILYNWYVYSARHSLVFSSLVLL